MGAPDVYVAADGRARVVYLAGRSTIDIAICVDTTCSAVDTTTLVDIAPAGRISHDGVGFDGDGRPMVAYWGDANPDGEREGSQFTAALWCVDTSCETVEHAELGSGSPKSVFSDAAFATSPDGRRSVATVGIPGGQRNISVTDCTEALCSPTTDDLILDPTDSVRNLALGFTPAGAPAIAFTTITSSAQPVRTLYYFACEDPTCVATTDPAPIFEGQPGDGLDPLPPIVTDSGITVLVTSEGDIIAITCADATCADPTPTTSLTGVGPGVDATSGSDGLPRIAWTDPAGQVNYSRCLDPTCSTLDTTTLDVATEQVSLAVGEETVYIATGIYPASLLVCPAEICTS